MKVERRWVRWLSRVAIATLEGFGAAHQNLGATPWLPNPACWRGLCAPSNHLGEKGG